MILVTVLLFLLVNMLACWPRLVLDIFIAFVDTFVLTLHFIMEADPNPFLAMSHRAALWLAWAV